MKEQTRSLLVGITVLVALVVLGAMILIFQELPTFMQVGYRVQLQFPDSAGAAEGADVLLAGKRIGRIIRVEFADDDARKGIILHALIDSDVNIPGNVNAYIQGRGIAGGAVIQIRSDGYPPGAGRKDPATGEPLAWIPKKGEFRIHGRMADGGLIPAKLRAQIAEATVSIKRLADKLDRFFTPPAAGDAPAAPRTTQPAANLFTTLAKLNAALDAVNRTLGDAENQANLKAGLSNLKSGLGSFKKAADAAAEVMAEARQVFGRAKVTFAEVSDATKSASKRFDDLALRLMDDADRLGKVLTIFHRSAAKLESSRGTAGKLLNDPRLYNTLVDATAQLKVTLDKLEVLLAEWRKKGIKLKLE